MTDRLTKERTMHTPGPWRIGVGCTNDGQTYVMNCELQEPARIALVDRQTPYKRGKGYEGECHARDANARLIAAAPQLLDALSALLNRYTQLVNCGDCGNWNPEIENDVIVARAAIAKATGAA